MTESTAHSQTSRFVKVKIEVDPNKVLQTSPDKLEDVENIFINK